MSFFVSEDVTEPVSKLRTLKERFFFEKNGFTQKNRDFFKDPLYSPNSNRTRALLGGIARKLNRVRSMRSSIATKVNTSAMRRPSDSGPEARE